jgi:hypothetical protein
MRVHRALTMAVCFLLIALGTDVMVAQKAPKMGYVHPPGGRLRRS